MASSSSASASASAQPDTASISIHITHRTQTHTLSLDPSTSVSSLRAQIEEITCVPVTHQKLLPSRARGVDLNVRAGASSSVATHEHDGVDGSVSEGSQGASEDGRTLTEAGVHGGMKIMVLGPSLEEVDRLRKADEEAGKRNAPRSYHPSMLRGTKVSLDLSSWGVEKYTFALG